MVAAQLCYLCQAIDDAASIAIDIIYRIEMYEWGAVWKAMSWGYCYNILGSTGVARMMLSPTDHRLC